MRLAAAPLLGLALLCPAGCADDTSARLLDLEGPEGRTPAPGPWPVRALARAGEVELHVQAGDGGVGAVPLSAEGGDRFAGLIDDQPPGTRVRYYATAAGERLPPEGAYVFEVVAPAAGADAGATPGDCALAFRAPRDGARLGPEDDAAPQAGLQLTVVVETNLDDGTPARLDVDGAGHAGVAGGGVVAFADVTLAPGPHVLTAEGRRPGGPPCAAAIRVEAAGPPGSAP
jgi:hypothetical protein